MTERRWPRRLGITGAVLLGLVGIALAARPAIYKAAAGKYNAVREPGPYAVEAEARELHGTLFVADMHADPLLWPRDLATRSKSVP